MIECRPYRNDDAPHVADIWNSQPENRAVLRNLTPALLEQHIFSKPYFDPAGFIIASEDQSPVGFVHAGFGSNADQSNIDTTAGVISVLMLKQEASHTETQALLLKAAEDYLKSKGATSVEGGSTAPRNPFYLGLLGGSRLRGVLQSDTALQDLYRQHEYAESQNTIVFQRELAGFRPVMDRTQMQIRRKYKTTSVIDPAPTSWWEACTRGQTLHTRFELHSPEGQLCAAIAYWNMEPLSSSWGQYAMGLSELIVSEDNRRKGIATFLISETLRQIQEQGVSLVESQVNANNEPAIALYKKLGFREVDHGVVFTKSFR